MADPAAAAGGGASANPAAPSPDVATTGKFRLVCCDFLRGHCSNGASSCQYTHSDLTATPCQFLDECPLHHCTRKWIPDGDRDHCFCCNGKFSLFQLRFRHHCRYCGEVVCGDCLVRTPSVAVFPVCKTCLG